MRQIIFDKISDNKDGKKEETLKGHFNEAGAFVDGERAPRNLIFDKVPGENKEQDLEKQENMSVKLEQNAEAPEMSEDKKRLIELQKIVDKYDKIKKLKFELGIDLTREEKEEYETAKKEFDGLLGSLRN